MDGRGNALKATAVVAPAAWVFAGCETVQGTSKTTIVKRTSR